MAQIRGTAAYHLGNQGAFGGPANVDATNDPSPLDAIREQTSKIEDLLDTYSEPIKPYVFLPVQCSRLPSRRVACFYVFSSLTHSNRYLPAIGRFLIVVTFLEDALRIVTQWSDQLLYLHDYRHSECKTHHQKSQGPSNDKAGADKGQSHAE
jgi:hypothetical protein